MLRMLSLSYSVPVLFFFHVFALHVSALPRIRSFSSSSLGLHFLMNSRLLPAKVRLEKYPRGQLVCGN